ncbi:MAG: N-acetylglucosamine-6-phosphate deacetylase [Ruminococcaceae bacterium]|nr:N-acetylglucosamine-6-phosphate deacetylase [Oscillospiraceae bacterium]
MRTLITNVEIITPGKTINNSSVLIRDGKIEAVYTDGIAPLIAVDEYVDGEGMYLSAGFIDLHVHGGGGHDFMDATEEAFIGGLETHLKHGTTSCVPTTLTAEMEELGDAFAAYRRVKASAKATELPDLLGMHLEGPYISAEMAGAQDLEYMKLPSDGSWKDIIRMAEGALKIWTVAPELEGAAEMCASLKDSGIIFSAGHSSARYSDVVAAIESGYTMATHLYSSMSTIIREQGHRVLGLLEASLLHDEICVEVIADGIHLPIPLLQLIYKTKGKDRMVLVTDAMRGAGMPDGDYLLGSLTRGQLVQVFDGIAHMPDGISFAGSVATTDRLVRVMTKQAGLPLHEVVTMLTVNPARELGIADRKGRISAGYDADLVLFDDDINVHGVWRGGRRLV